MRGQYSPHPIDLSIRAGEIFGIAGFGETGGTFLFERFLASTALGGQRTGRNQD